MTHYTELALPVRTEMASSSYIVEEVAKDVGTVRYLHLPYVALLSNVISYCHRLCFGLALRELTARNIAATRISLSLLLHGFVKFFFVVPIVGR